MAMTLLIREESMGQKSEPEIDLANCVSWGDQTEISQRQGDMIRGVPAKPKSYYHSMRFISSSINKKSHFSNGDHIFVESYD